MPKRLLAIVRIPVGPRSAAALIAYTAILAGSFFLAYEIRFDFAVRPEFQEERLRLIAYAVLGKIVLLVLSRQVGTVLRYFSIPDLLRIGGAMVVASVLLITPRILNAPNYVMPRGVLVIDFMLSVAGLCAFRLTLRLLQERLVLAQRFPSRKLEKIAIIGAGDTGASLANDLLNMPARGLKPIAFFDDQPNKRGTLVHGVEVIGAPELLPESSAAEVNKVVIAMPSAPQKRVREIVLFLAQHGYTVEIVPALEDLASGRAKTTRIRRVEVEDLLGREEVTLDAGAIRGLVENKCVLVTGAGGSIGSEICRQVVRLNPRRLLMVEQSEPSLFLIEQELGHGGFGGTVVPLVGDILDEKRMDAVFAFHRPQVIFHAAAHKHVFMMERQPSEAVKNNSAGTRKLAAIAIAHGAEAFVLISTDKAVNPTNAMGASKRLAELHLQALHAALQRETGSMDQGAGDSTAVSGGAGFAAAEIHRDKPAVVLARREVGHRFGVHGGQPAVDGDRSAASDTMGPAEAPRAHETGGKRGPMGLGLRAEAAPLLPIPSSSPDAGTAPATKLMAVRFGNVLGSSGSVVPIFKKQIEAGGPVTVTHPDVTRYFMTIPEAVGLVLQASVLGKGGEIFVLDMGQPMKIVDLAKHMIELSGFKVGEDIEITFTGLKPGEKLYEELQHQTEKHQPTAHPRIMRFVSNGDPAKASEMAIREIEPFVDEMTPTDVKCALKAVIPEYDPCLE
jgi:FlaA1/EpsC-like NDP-sugar epimerase